MLSFQLFDEALSQLQTQILLFVRKEKIKCCAEIFQIENLTGVVLI